MTGLPDWLLRLPRLSWLAYAGNAFCEEVDEAWQQDARTHPVAWEALTLSRVLGEVRRA